MRRGMVEKYVYRFSTKRWEKDKMEKCFAKGDSNGLEHWGKIVADRHSSGQSVKAYCINKGITLNSYYYYLGKMRDLETAEPVLVPVVFEKFEERPSLVSIQYHGATMHVPANDETLLCAVFSALKKV